MIDLLDTHQHLLYRDTLSYPWTDALPKLAQRNFTTSDYWSLVQGRRVASTIFMEVDAHDYRAETRFVHELSQVPENGIVGLISSCRPEKDEGFEAWLEECSELSVVGYRRILHEVSDDVSQTEGFRNNVRKIGRDGKVFDMVFRADQLNLADELAKSLDEMTLVLDHCGVPDIASGSMKEWKFSITRIAQKQNVIGKLSGVLAYCSEGSATHDAVKPYVDHMIESFGPSRLIWGSDWPVVNLKSTLPDWIDVFRELISDLSVDEQTAISNLNAQRIYGVQC